MQSFLEHFIVYWLYLNLLCIFFYILHLLYVNKDNIFYLIKKHKVIYILLFILFVTGTILRINFVSTFTWDDEIAYSRQGILVAQNRSFSYLYTGDSPSFSILISIFMRELEILNKDYTKFTSSHASAVFGSLSIILIFILVQVLFKNHIVSLLSAFLLTFNNLHLEYSVKGFPTVSSTFLSMIVIILLVNSIRTKSFLSYIVTGLALGITAQMYYIELVLIIPTIIYLIFSLNIKVKNVSNKIRISLNFKRVIVVCLLFSSLLASILPFIILQHITPRGDCFSKDNIVKKLSCVWVSQKFLNSNHSLNHINNTYLSFFGFAFLGVGYEQSFDTTFPFDGLMYVLHNYYLVNNEISIIYIIGSLLIILGFIFSRSYRKERYLILAVILSFIIVGGFSERPQRLLLVPAITFQLILISYGLVTLSNKIVKKPLLIIMLISIILISPFFTEHMLTNLKTIKGDTLKTNWEQIHQTLMEWNKTKCNNIHLDRYKNECRNWIDVNNIIKNQSNCDIIENKYYEEKCLERNITYMLIKKVINNSFSPAGERGLCYNLSVVRFYCKSPIPDKGEVKYIHYDDYNLSLDISLDYCSKFNQTMKKDCLNALSINEELRQKYWQNLPYRIHNFSPDVFDCFSNPSIIREMCFIVDLFGI